MLRRRFSLLAVIPIFLVSWWPRQAGAGEAPADSPGAAGGLPLEILTFNIRYPNWEDGPNHWSFRIGFVADVMRERNPDIIGVQEALRSQLDDVVKRLPEYAEIGVGRDDGKQAGEYSPILYRKKTIELRESGTFWLSDTPEVPGSRSWKNVCPRICTWARFRHISTGRTFYVFNSHWDNASEEARTKGGKLIAERILARTAKEDPVIVTGDFNCGEDSRQVTALKASLKLRDSFRDVHPDAGEAGTIHFWSGSKSRAKIDYILVDSHAAVSEAEIIHTSRGGRFPSDHFPVRAKLVLKNPENPPVRKGGS